MNLLRTVAALMLLLVGCAVQPGALPARYYRLMEAGLPAVETRLAAEPNAELPYPILAAAVLYTSQHPANVSRGDARWLALAVRLGDLLAGESHKGSGGTRLDHRELYLWIETFRILEKHLGQERRVRWRTEIERNVSALAEAVARREHFPRYQAPYLRTSTNHYALWASTVYLAGRVIGNRDWEELGGHVMHRFTAKERTPDGYWGEHSDAGPTAGCDYLTFASVALYAEHPDGRRYAELLTGFFADGRIDMEMLGRIAQDALYFHEGPTSPIPQDSTCFAYRMQVPAGIRKSGPWTVALSALTSTPSIANQFLLDRQGHLSIFHEKLGLTVSGANSERQPELATFFETVKGQLNHLPINSTLRMEDSVDRLSLAYTTFFADLEVPEPLPQSVAFRFVITEMGRVEEARLSIQLVLKPGEILATPNARVVLGADRLELGPDEIAGVIRHHGWSLKVDPSARLLWPVYPFNPYANGPETRLDFAVGVLSVPLRPKSASGRLRTQDIRFVLEAAR